MICYTAAERARRIRSHRKTTRSSCRLETLEQRLFLVIAGTRIGPDLADEFIRFRLPLATDTTTHYYFDRNTASGSTLAWNGTTQTYDGHTGTDFSGGPRGRAIYAAAGGYIVTKVDGFGDQEGTANGNYVKLNHGNDRNGVPINTFYLHLNAGSLTTKNVGDYVAAGELVGGVGTSGNSTGLHLHFHLSYNGTAIDPFKANGSSEVSWWANQGSGSPSTAAPPNKFDIGDNVQVFALTGSGTLTVRSPDPTSASIGSKSNGVLGTVLAGPVLSFTGGDYTGNVYNRWKVHFSDGMEGWVAQNWLQEVVTPPPPPPAPEMQIQYTGGIIADGTTTPVSFPSVEKRQTGPTISFTIRNYGDAILSLGTITLPTGYSLVEGVNANVQPGAFDNFTVRLDSTTVGTKSGQISVVNNDADENPYNFAITGTVTADVTPPAADVIDVSPDPFNGPLSSMTIVFSEPVSGFDKSDLTFTRNGASIALTATQTLTTSDNITFTLGGLAPLTDASGTYVLTVTGGLTDDSANPLAAPASDTFKLQTNVFRGGDAYYLRRSGDGTKVEIFENADPVGTPTYSLAWAGLASLTFDTGGGANTVAIDYANGSPVPAGADGFSYLATGANNALQVRNGGSFTFFADAALSTPNLQVVATGTDVIFNTSQHLAALVLDASDGSIGGNGTTIVIKSLQLLNNATLDLAANAIAVDYVSTSPLGDWTGGNYDGLTGLLAAGQLFSSAADGQHYALGIAESSDVLGISDAATETWRDETIDATSVLVKFTYVGDFNLDGTVNGDDYFQIDSHILQSGSVFGYYTGDINLDGEINGDDYFWIDSNILFAQNSPIL